MRGLGTTALVVSIVLAMGMLTDFLWVLPQAGRWAIWAAALASIVITFAISVVRSTFRRGNAFDLAAVAERGNGALEEQLTGAVGLLGSGSRSHGSPRLIAAVAERAAEHAGSVELSSGGSVGTSNRMAGDGAHWSWPGDCSALSVARRPGDRARHFFPGRASSGRAARALGTPVTRLCRWGRSILHLRRHYAARPMPCPAWPEWSAAGDTTHRTAMPVSRGKISKEENVCTKSREISR